MRQNKSVINKMDLVFIVGQVFHVFSSYKVNGFFWRHLKDAKRCLVEKNKSIYFFSFLELLNRIVLSSESRKRNIFFFFFKEEFNLLYIEHLLCLYFKTYLTVNWKKDFLLKRVVSFFFWFIKLVCLDVVDESNSCSLLEKCSYLVNESKVFPFLSELESEKVVISVNRKVCFFQAISLFCELIWNMSYLNFFFFEKRRFFFFLGKLLESVFFFYEVSHLYISFFFKVKNVEKNDRRVFFCKLVRNVQFQEKVFDV
jgi:hypothetical protein